MADTAFEKVLEEVGDKGRYQKLLYWLFVLPLNFLIPWVALAPIFMTATPEHWCHVPGRPEALTEEQWKQLTIPREGDDYSKCQQYNVTGDALLSLLEPTLPDISNITTEFGITFGIIECQAGWDYDRSSYTHTLTMQQEWVCDRASMGSTWMSVGVVGNVVGTLIFNSLSDFIGRRPVVVVSVMMFAVFGVARLYATSTAWLMVSMFLASTSFPPMLELALIIVLEQVSHGWRSRITSSSFIVWQMGSCLLALFAWLAPHWQVLGLITTVPFFAFIVCWWLLPESPRWLLSRNRIEECAAQLRRIAAINKLTVPDKLEDTLRAMAQVQNTEANYGAVQLCKYPTVRLRTFLLTACYTFNNFFYYGLTYNMTNLSGNDFINFFLLSLIELPSNLLGWWGSQTFGRRWTAAGGFALASFFSLATALVQDVDNVWVPIVLLIISKFFITVSFLLVYVQCAEIYPTTHRACGTGLSSFVSSCFGVAAPYVSYVSTYGSWISFIILFVVGVMGYICASFLPETLNTKLPQSLQEANVFLVDEKYWSYKGSRCRSRKIEITHYGTNEGKINRAMSVEDMSEKAKDLDGGKINMAMSVEDMSEKANCSE